MHDGDLVAHERVDERGVGADARARADGGVAAQAAPGLHHGVGADAHAGVDEVAPGSTRVTPPHVGVVEAGLGDGAHDGQLGAIVDAERERGVGETVGDHRGTAGAQQGHDVGEVTLALGVVGADARQGLEEGGAVEGVDPGVDLADGELLGSGVARGLGLHDPLHRAVGGADDAAEAGGVLELDDAEGGGGARGGMAVQERAQRLAGDEGRVAVDDEHHRRGIDAPGGGVDGVAGAERLRLDRELHARGEMRLERPVRAAHDHDAPGAHLASRGDGPGEQRPAAQRMEHLGDGRTHARPVARGEDHDRGGGHGAIVEAGGSGGRARHARTGAEQAGGRGLEPRFAGPKPAVLASSDDPQRAFHCEASVRPYRTARYSAPEEARRRGVTPTVRAGTSRPPARSRARRATGASPPAPARTSPCSPR